MTTPSPETTPPQTMALQGLANRIMRGLLRTPGINRGMGKSLITLYVVGRKSGKRYDIPVAYARHDGDLLIGTPFGWGRNLRTGESVDMRLQGRRVTADVKAYTDEATVVEIYGIMASELKQFAKFNKIAIDESGTPNAADLHAAWAGGARAFRLTPR